MPNSRLKVLYITRSFTVHDRRFLEAFGKGRINVAVVTLKEPTVLLTSLSLPDCIQHLANLNLDNEASEGSFERAAGSLTVLASQFEPNVALAGPITDCGYLAAQAHLNCPLVLQSWAFDVFWERASNSLMAWRTQFALQNSDALFSDCRAVGLECERLLDKPIVQRFAMPWGIEVNPPLDDKRRTAIRSELSLGSQNVFIHCRGFDPIYCIETLTLAFKEYHYSSPASVLLLASTGAGEEAVRTYVQENNLENNIKFLGRVSNARLLDLFHSSDCYVSCAASDGSSISLLEAMAAGLPVIVNDRGGNPEWVNAQKNGWVVPFGDMMALAHAMKDASELDPVKRRQIAFHNRELISTHADWAKNFPGFVQFLSGVRKKRPGDICVA